MHTSLELEKRLVGINVLVFVLLSKDDDTGHVVVNRSIVNISHGVNLSMRFSQFWAYNRIMAEYPTGLTPNIGWFLGRRLLGGVA